MPSTNPEAAQLLDKLNDNADKQDKLRAELSKSVVLRQFCPDAFEHGQCTTQVRANAFSPEFATFTITRGDGSKHAYKLLDVPVQLWQAQYDNMLKQSPNVRIALNKRNQQEAAP